MFALMVTVGDQPSYQRDTFPSYSACVAAAQAKVESLGDGARWQCVPEDRRRDTAALHREDWRPWSFARSIRGEHIGGLNVRYRTTVIVLLCIVSLGGLRRTSLADDMAIYTEYLPDLLTTPPKRKNDIFVALPPRAKNTTAPGLTVRLLPTLKRACA
jgi:hypothetical protein